MKFIERLEINCHKFYPWKGERQMKTEKEKMLEGLWYDANFDEELVEERNKAKDLCYELNQTRPTNTKKRQEITKKILGELPEGVSLSSPLMVDYGFNIKLGKNVDVNHDCYFMDGAPISLGDNVLVGPSCGFYTATHPLNYKDRNQGFEKAKPIDIGDNVWFGANVTVLPGVSIGSGCVIGAGSVVADDIPENSLAYGNPCKVVRRIEQK